jgi:hypothetical protein
MDAELAHFKVEAGDRVACGSNLLQQKCIRDARGPICMTCASGPQTRAEPLIPGAILAEGIRACGGFSKPACEAFPTGRYTNKLAAFFCVNPEITIRRNPKRAVVQPPIRPSFPVDRASSGGRLRRGRQEKRFDERRQSVGWGQVHSTKRTTSWGI